MNEIIDVEFRELRNIEDKTTEELAQEANTLWQQMEIIGNIGLMMAVQAGQRLQVIKSRLQHGEWEKWCEDNLQFSKSKAEKMLKLAKKASDENSIFSKTETFTDLGISRVWALLSAPEEVAKEIVEDPESKDLTVRELQDKIRVLTDEAKASKEKADEESGKAGELRKELKAVKEQVKTLEGQVKAQATNAEREKIEADTELREELEKLREEKNTLTEKLRHAEESAAKSENKALAVFKVKADALQETFNACLSSINEVALQDAQQAQKMKLALGQVMDTLKGRL